MTREHALYISLIWASLLFLRESGAPLNPPGDRPSGGGALLLRVHWHPLCCQWGTADSVPRGHGWNSGNGAGALSQTNTWLWERRPGSCHRPKQPPSHAHVAETLCPKKPSPRWANPIPVTIHFSHVVILTLKVRTCAPPTALHFKNWWW